MDNEIAKKDSTLICTENLVKKIIRKYMDLGYTKDSAFEHLQQVVDNLQGKRKGNNLAKIDNNNDYDLMRSMSTMQ